jgi:crotonobetainyl-CoA:carnitine CoA-transferase CaiB-like acyl-CoA transferase
LNAEELATVKKVRAFMEAKVAPVVTKYWLDDAFVPLDGAGGRLGTTIGSPIQVHGITKVPARRAPALGEHNAEVLEQLGFSTGEIDALSASGAVPTTKAPARAAIG